MKFRGVIILFSLLGLISSSANAQEKDIKPSSVYDFNQFSFEFQTGINRTQFLRETGVEEFADKIENVQLFTASYQFNFGKHFGLRIRAGFGLQPYVRSFEKRKRVFAFGPGLPSINVTEYSLLTRLGFSFNYHKEFKNSRWGLDALVGGASSINFGGGGGGNGFTITDDGLINIYNIFVDYEDIPGLILDGSIGITRQLNNRDLVGLYLAGEYHFKPIITGTYNFEDIISSGRILNSGNSIGLKLRYSFTRSRRKDQIAEITILTKDARLGKQTYKREKRNTISENMYVRSGSGIFNGRNITRGNLDQIRSSSNRGFRHFIAFEKGLQNQYFYEGGLSVERYYSSIKLQDIVMVHTNEFVAATASVGYGKRFIRKKTNWNFLTISAGAAASHRLDFIDLGGFNGTTTYGNYEWTIESEGVIQESPLFFSLYASLTHDVRVADRIYLSFNYRFHQGLNTAVRETVRFTANPGNIEGDITRKINGTSNTLSVGLKFRLPN